VTRVGLGFFDVVWGGGFAGVVVCSSVGESPGYVLEYGVQK
jgi:hypothetical protein